MSPDGRRVLFRAGNNPGNVGLVTEAASTAALEALESILDSEARVLGRDHPDILTAHHNLAYWWGAAGDPTASVEAYKSLLEDRCRVLGGDRPETLTTRHNLAFWRGY